MFTQTKQFTWRAVRVILCATFIIGLFAQYALAGKIVARGSDSTLSVVKALADAYQKKTGNVLKIEGGGSSKGAKDCLAGNVDMAFMSRGPKEKEVSAGLVALPYAIDGVAIIVNQRNPADNLTIPQLKAIYTGAIKKWDNGKPVMAFNRPTTSGTREVFQKKVLGKKTKFDPKIPIKHDKASMMTVSKAITGIAYTSIGSLSGNEAVKVVPVEGVFPNAETLRSKTYPIARTLHFATKGSAHSNVQAFLDFVLSTEGRKIIEQTGFVPL